MVSRADDLILVVQVLSQFLLAALARPNVVGKCKELQSDIDMKFDNEIDYI